METETTQITELLKEAEAILKQVNLFKANRSSDKKTLPTELRGRMEYVVGYATAIKERQRLEKEGKWDEHCTFVMSEMHKQWKFTGRRAR